MRIASIAACGTCGGVGGLPLSVRAHGSIICHFGRAQLTSMSSIHNIVCGSADCLQRRFEPKARGVVDVGRLQAGGLAERYSAYFGYLYPCVVPGLVLSYDYWQQAQPVASLLHIDSNARLLVIPSCCQHNFIFEKGGPYR